MATDPALSATYGSWLIDLLLDAILYGAGMLQAWLYFHWYKTDHWAIKTLVTSLAIAETLSVGMYFAATYDIFVGNYGDFNAIFIIKWPETFRIILGFFVAFQVQLYFAYTIYAVNRNLRRTASFSIVALAVLQLGTGAATASILILDRDLMKLGNPSLKALFTIQSVATALCDIVIAVILATTLGSHKNSNCRSTDTILNTLITYAINRGALSAIFSVLYIILFWAFPNSFYFWIAFIPHTKIYMNSAMASLNSRHHIVRKANGTEYGLQSLQLNTLRAVGNNSTEENSYHISTENSTKILRVDQLEDAKPRVVGE